MRVSNKLSIAVIFLVFSVPGFAADTDEATSDAAATPARSATTSADLNPWTKCGIGAMIFPETQAGAVISNIIWDLGTTAVTSAASSKNTCEGRDVQAAIFIQDTYANLEEETAKGSGQHITAMLTMLGCESTAHANIVDAIRTDFSQSINAPDYAGKNAETKAQDYYKLVTSKVTGAYAAQCQII